MAVFSVVTVLGANIYVAPDGRPDGNGSEKEPLDIFTAISKDSPAKPGDTVILMAGQYDGETTTKTVKGQERPLVVRTPFCPKLSGTAEQPVIITSESGKWAHLNGAVQVDGADYLHFLRIEIGDLDWDPYREEHDVPTAFNALKGEAIKIINCNIFGGAMGTGLWRPAHDLEAYGNIIHDFGYMQRSGGRGHGHAFYVQNTEGTKTIEQNIAYRSCGWLYDIYTQQGEIKGFDIIGNIGFLAGYHREGQTSFSFGLTGWKAAERIRFIGNVAYQPHDAQQWRANMRLMTHYKKDVVHHDAVVTDNYIMGAYRAFTVGLWQQMVVSNNTFWGTHFLAELNSAPSGSGITESPAPPSLANYTYDHNTYYETAESKPFIYGRHEGVTPEEMLTFDQWQKLGLDRNSRLLPGKNGKPTGDKVFVFPNKYERGRANVAIFNWDRQKSVSVDLSNVLEKGRKYVVYSCQDIKQTITMAKPILRGKYRGKEVSFPMRKNERCPDFDAFLVLPRS